MQNRIRLLALFSMLCLIANGSAQGRVWVVDSHGGKGFDFRNLHDAVRAARDGDALLIRKGTYDALKGVIIDKSLTLGVDPKTPGNLRTLVPVIHVQNLRAAQRVTLQGLWFSSLHVTDCAGSVSLQDCRQVKVSSHLVHGVRVRNSRAVTIADCRFQPDTAAPGLQVDGSTVFAYRSEFKAVFPGVPGARVERSNRGWQLPRLQAVDCTIVGGDGRSGLPLGARCYTKGAPGGDGVVAWSGSVTLTECIVRPGRGATANGPCPAYSAGRPTHSQGGTILIRSQAPRALHTNTVLREGERLDIELAGKNGDHVWLLYQLRHEPISIPGCSGALFPALQNIGTLYVGQIATGSRRLSVVVQPMAASMNFSNLVLQSLFLPRSGCVLSAPVSVLLLDRRY